MKNLFDSLVRTYVPWLVGVVIVGFVAAGVTAMVVKIFTGG